MRWTGSWKRKIQGHLRRAGPDLRRDVRLLNLPSLLHFPLYCRLESRRISAGRPLHCGFLRQILTNFQLSFSRNFSRIVRLMLSNIYLLHELDVSLPRLELFIATLKFFRANCRYFLCKAHWGALVNKQNKKKCIFSSQIVEILVVHDLPKN